MKLIYRLLNNFQKLFLILIISSCIFSLAGCTKKTKSVQVQENHNGICCYNYYNDIGMWNYIFEKTDAFVLPENSIPVSMMIPHHDITTGNQNSFYKAVSQKIAPSIIVIISPNHFEKGQKLITLPKETTFESPEGNLILDENLINKIASSNELKNVVSLQNDLWYEEHGIFIHSPFLKHYFPQAKIVPVLVKMLSTEDEFKYYKTLGKFLSENLPPDTLVISSVDCSHYQIPKVTEYHDSATRNNLLNMEDPRFAEIDSPESITALFEYNKNRMAYNPVIVHHSSTYDYIPDPMIESTSHYYCAFYKDEVKDETTDFLSKVSLTNQDYYLPKKESILQTILLTGSGSSLAGIRRTWYWDRYNQAVEQPEILLKDAAGKEARFFYGFDSLIFDPKPDTTYTQNVHNTELKIDTSYFKDFYTLQNKDYKKQNDFDTAKNRVDKLLENKNKQINIKILYADDFLSYNEKTKQYDFASKQNISFLQAMSFFCSKYDLVLIREETGTQSAVLYYFDISDTPENQNQKLNIVPIGICIGKGQIEGKVVMADFNYSKNSYKLKIDFLDYTSQEGIIPAIHQFLPE